MPATDHIAAVRRFNRFYTQRIGVLDEGLVETSFSLAEARVLYELAHRDRPTAVDMVRDLGLDPGYLSRILRRFEQHGIVRKHPSSEDGRRSILRLTPRGVREFGVLNASTNAHIGSMLSALSPAQQTRLLTALRTVEKLLDGFSATSPGRARRRRRAGGAHASTEK